MRIFPVYSLYTEMKFENYGYIDIGHPIFWKGGGVYAKLWGRGCG